MNEEDLYDRIDEDENMSDQEKREAYNSEVQNCEDERFWEDHQ